MMPVSMQISQHAAGYYQSSQKEGCQANVLAELGLQQAGQMPDTASQVCWDITCHIMQ